jgi:hypothetical protein
MLTSPAVSFPTNDLARQIPARLLLAVSATHLLRVTLEALPTSRHQAMREYGEQVAHGPCLNLMQASLAAVEQ